MMNKDNNNNNNKKKVINTIFNTSLSSTNKNNNRYCTICHVRLEPSKTDKYIYTCPNCGVGPVNIFNTEPAERLIATFPTVDPTTNAISNKNKNKFIQQPPADRIPRSKYFQQKILQEKNKAEGIEDPYLKILMNNNKIRITNIDYNEPTE